MYAGTILPVAALVAPPILVRISPQFPVAATRLIASATRVAHNASATKANVSADIPISEDVIALHAHASNVSPEAIPLMSPVGAVPMPAAGDSQVGLDIIPDEFGAASAVPVIPSASSSTPLPVVNANVAPVQQLAPLPPLPSMLFVATGRVSYVIISLGLLAIGFVFCYHFFGHVQTRVDIWLNPWKDPSGSGYQIVQSLYSIADGGLTGTGIGKGMPTLIPVVESDFLFSAIAEEMGLLGSTAVLVLFMVQPDGNIKVMDFGIARAKNSHLTTDNSVLGTAHYVSPEQTQGKELGPTTDIYSLGIVMYEASTGRVPFEGDDAISVALKQVNEQPVPPSQHNPTIDPQLESIILKCMEELDTYMHYYAEEREKESLGWLSPLRYRKSLGIAV